MLGVTASFGLIGFVDDFLKLKTASSNGMSSRLKIVLQIIVAALVAFPDFLIWTSRNKGKFECPIFQRYFY